MINDETQQREYGRKSQRDSLSVSWGNDTRNGAGTTTNSTLPYNRSIDPPSSSTKPNSLDGPRAEEMQDTSTMLDDRVYYDHLGAGKEENNIE